MLLPDDLIIKNNCSLSMIKLHKKFKSSVIASKKVDKKNVSRWGIFNLDKLHKKYFLILQFFLHHHFEYHIGAKKLLLQFLQYLQLLSLIHI